MRLKTLGFAALTATLAACGGGGGGSTPVAVTPTPVTCTAPAVLTNGVCVTPAPTVSVQLTKSKTAVGSPVTLSWTSTNASSCVGMDALSGTKAINNSEVITPSKGGQYTYTISCDGAGGTVKQSVPLVVPMQLYKSSYENKMAAGNVLGPQILPVPVYNTPYAFADFLQNGTYTMVVSILEYDLNKPISQASNGHIHFYQHISGKWSDITSILLSDNTGCIHPRKAMVADLNGDGKPDVVFACHGYDNSPSLGLPPPGEQQRVLLSQVDGTYKNVLLPITAYAHGGSVADVSGNGYADIIYTDTSIRKEPFYLVNNQNGTFTENANRTPQATKKFTCFTAATCEYSIYSMDFVDFNADGKYDLWIGGSIHPADSNGFNNSINAAIFYNTGNNIFTNVNPTKLPTSFTSGASLDVIFIAGKVIMLNTLDYSGVSIDVVNITDMTLTTPYTHTGGYANTTWMTWIPWINIFNGNIVASDAIFQLSVPLQ
jgi:hypothetical protein